MAFIPVPDTMLVEMRMSLYGQQIENTLYFSKIGGVSTADATALWNALLLWWTTDYAVVVSDDLSLREGQITDLSSASGFGLTFAAPTPNPTGDVADEGLPSNVAMCVSFRTPLRGRSYRGRNYVSGLPEPSVVGNTFNPTYMGFLLTAYQNLIPLASGLGLEWVVVSRYSGNAPRVTGVHTEITSVSIVDPYVDSQRRRLTGRGN